MQKFSVGIVSLLSEKPSDIERIVIPVKLGASRSISSVNLQQKIVIHVSSDKPAAQESKCVSCSLKTVACPFVA
jgi:hypothetical protein